MYKSKYRHFFQWRVTFMDCVCTAQNIGNCFEAITITGQKATILLYLPDTNLLQPMPTAARHPETKSH